MRGWLVGVGAALFCAGLASAQEQCGGEAAETATVARISGERSFVLADGREFLLAGIEVPLSARGALEALLKERAVSLRAAGTPDRYGRIPAFVQVGNVSVQRQLLAQGNARVAARSGGKGCATALLAAEAAARAARVGLWADPEYAIRRAENGADLLAERGRFALAEGRVLSVRETGGIIYVNFGRRWSEALTVTIAKRNERIFSDAGLTPKALERRQIRVRGVVEARNGPRIEAARPEQIEIVERN